MMWNSRAFKKIRAGRIAKHRGADFETMLMWAARRQNIICIKIQDGCRTVSKNKIIRAKQPFDFIFAHMTEGKSAFIDAKAIDQKSYPKSQMDTQQCEALLSLAYCKQIAGYIVYFRPLNEIIFFNAFKLNDLLPGHSLKSEDGIRLGPSEQIDLSPIFRAAGC